MEKKSGLLKSGTPEAFLSFEVEVVEPLRKLRDEGRIEIEEVPVPGQYRIVHVFLREILKERFHIIVSPRSFLRQPASRFQHNLYAAILLLGKDLIRIRRLLERQAMRDDVVQLDLTLFDQFHQSIDIFWHRRLP